MTNGVHPPTTRAIAFVSGCTPFVLSENTKLQKTI
jgi:hypothetical protein